MSQSRWQFPLENEKGKGVICHFCHCFLWDTNLLKSSAGEILFQNKYAWGSHTPFSWEWQNDKSRLNQFVIVEWSNSLVLLHYGFYPLPCAELDVTAWELDSHRLLRRAWRGGTGRISAVPNSSAMSLCRCQLWIEKISQGSFKYFKTWK